MQLGMHLTRHSACHLITSGIGKGIVKGTGLRAVFFLAVYAIAVDHLNFRWVFIVEAPCEGGRRLLH